MKVRVSYGQPPSSQFLDRFQPGSNWEARGLAWQFVYSLFCLAHEGYPKGIGDKRTVENSFAGIQDSLHECRIHVFRISQCEQFTAGVDSACSTGYYVGTLETS